MLHDIDKTNHDAGIIKRGGDQHDYSAATDVSPLV
jgi:hypothetical protein